MKKIEWKTKDNITYIYNDSKYQIIIQQNPIDNNWYWEINTTLYGQENSLKKTKLICENYVYEREATIENKICLDFLNKYADVIFKENMIFSFANIFSLSVSWSNAKKELKVYDPYIAEKYLNCSKEQIEEGIYYLPFFDSSKMVTNKLPNDLYKFYELEDFDVEKIFNMLKAYNAKII
jgi:hypothetical protein